MVMEEGQSYLVKARVDILFQKCYLEEYVGEEVRCEVCTDGKICVACMKEVCMVCREELSPSASLRKIQCGHVYHRDCILRWLWWSAVCPYCKTDVELEMYKKKKI
ncbi:hypothetical protein CARUB_v10007427mg [Capsella rubella]|uniref:RING-type domain-containing protein n=1 Tax=Capsella rubella TaxID=81985 RepID=R0GPK8_9BRAS|nr:hypothetical protein CARUB_v10007427mg [Capsella rubella]